MGNLSDGSKTKEGYHLKENGTNGAKKWFIPDAYLPSSGLGEVHQGHEAICVLNVTSFQAMLNISFFFSDREPLENIIVTVGAKRCLHLRLDHPDEIAGIVLTRDVPYGIKIESDTHIIVQYSRLDVTQPNYALMTTVPYFE
ncbi:anabaena sensory rhodopsin transducer [Peptococcaceae bacterium CEB3]|nr:anabaena sensory rhodopsin transducer [Peptococcaceae bacterium CEB3]